MSSMLPPKREPSHLRKHFILGSGNTALANMSQSSCYYHFTAYRQSAIWLYISTAFDGSPGRRSDTTAITVAGDTHTHEDAEQIPCHVERLIFQLVTHQLLLKLRVAE